MLRKGSPSVLVCLSRPKVLATRFRSLSSVTHTAFEGLYAATLTAWTSKGDPALDGIEKYARKLIQDKVQGVFVCGTSGESMSLSVSERKQILEKWVAHGRPQSSGGPGLKVIAHIGAASLKDSCELAAHAEGLGVAAISAMPPFFFKPRDVPTLVEHMGRVAAAASRTPFLYYHFPDITGVNIPVYDFMVAGSKVIPTLSGVKFTSTDLGDFYRCITLEGGNRYSIMQGYEQMMLPCLALGARGFIGLSYSYGAPVYHRLSDAFRKGDLTTARDLQLKVTNLVTPCAKMGYIPTAKLLMLKVAGLEFGGSRLPNRSLSEGEAATFLAEPGVKTFVAKL